MSAAGRSASAQAKAMRAQARRGAWRRVTAWVGLNPEAARADAVAGRWVRGADAEKATARLLRRLRWRGWRILHDRQLPGSRANLDHVLVSPCGTAVVALDTKRWHAQRRTCLVGGRVHCGAEDRHGQVEAVARYAARVSQALAVPGVVVWPLLVVHGSPIRGGRLEARAPGWAGPVWVLGPDCLVPTLAAAPRGRNRVRAAALARRVAALLPPYRAGGAR